MMLNLPLVGWHLCYLAFETTWTGNNVETEIEDGEIRSSKQLYLTENMKWIETGYVGKYALNRQILEVFLERLNGCS